MAGVISPAGRPFRGALSLPALATSIEHAFAMRGVRAVALAINSPGGSPVQSALIARRVRVLARENDLPVFAFIEDVAASGGYWLACAADEIFADRSSIVGSIGVVSAGFGFADAIKKLGVERRLHTQGRYKAILDPFRPEDADEVQRLSIIQKDIHEAFKDHVRDRRGKRLKGDDAALFEGEIWTGGQARALGLIDGLGDMRTILRERFGDKVRLRPVAPPRRWFRQRLGLGLGLGGLAGADSGDLIAGLLDAVEARALWARYGF
tara:strand:+ start:5 stop:802 length:798 start_codon:yes stop_codon:yes gene_type:complete